MAVIASVLALLGAGTALAHNALTGTNPADGAQVSVGPSEIVLTFDQTVQNYEPLVTVTGPDGGRWQGSPIAVLNNTVTVPLSPLGPAGDYTVAFRIISADGHPVEGTSTFTLSAAGTGVANPDTPVAREADSGIPSWAWIVGGTVVVVLLAVGAVVSGRRREN
ncbi:copper resistance CopC family protein [Nakamurella antarctica]|uniref:copper resistance CopC family protein n=1 Tax=Nakamurella antarctica TaxID=1902245 RepID=UPI001EF0B900|nr:copper resistance CopC family protein [Nakamurella antarctica]